MGFVHMEKEKVTLFKISFPLVFLYLGFSCCKECPVVLFTFLHTFDLSRFTAYGMISLRFNVSDLVWDYLIYNPSLTSFTSG